MLTPLSRIVRILASALTGVSCLFCGASHVLGGTELEAAAVLGKGDAGVLKLVRELTDWRSRAESSEALLARAGLQVPAPGRSALNEQAHVLSFLEGERVVVISAGRLSGATLGSLVSVGDKVVAKVVESRETVSAALVDQSYHGRVGALEGSLVRLLVVRP